MLVNNGSDVSPGLSSWPCQGGALGGNKQFRSLPTNCSSYTSLGSSNVSGVYVDSSNNIFVAANGGLSVDPADQ